MRTSTYFDLKLIEGTDIVNPLLTEVPNLTKIDEVMYNNSIAGVTIATEVTNGTVHAFLRENTDCAIFRFVATSEWQLGDTATVDGVPVTALLPSGEVLGKGAYVINANVLCVLTGTNLTVFVGGGGKQDYNASDIGYNNATVKDALDTTNQSIVNINNTLTDINNDVASVNNKLGVIVGSYINADGDLVIQYEDGEVTA